MLHYIVMLCDICAILPIVSRNLRKRCRSTKHDDRTRAGARVVTEVVAYTVILQFICDKKLKGIDLP